MCINFIKHTHIRLKYTNTHTRAHVRLYIYLFIYSSLSYSFFTCVSIYSYISTYTFPCIYAGYASHPLTDPRNMTDSLRLTSRNTEQRQNTHWIFSDEVTKKQQLKLSHETECIKHWQRFYPVIFRSLQNYDSKSSGSSTDFISFFYDFSKMSFLTSLLTWRWYHVQVEKY